MTSKATGLQIRFWGVRGSFPVPGPDTAVIGGNSSCVEIRAGGHLLIFDGGTGIINLGRSLLNGNGTRALHLFLSHLHHDHIEGLRFFAPFYDSSWHCEVYGPHSGLNEFHRALESTMEPRVFPVSLGDLQARIHIQDLPESDRLVFDGDPPVEILTQHSKAHPKFGVQLYRVTCGTRSVVYATDVEAPYGGLEDVVRFAKGADVLIHDSQYTDDEYHREVANKKGWGHSTVRMAAEAALAADVGELIMYHHDPCRTDNQIPELEQLAQAIFPRTRAAREGLTITLHDEPVAR
jgi:phosphoribosyl 1,2-cyclic phosphodiesterase